jgi:hypothetical protein
LVSFAQLLLPLHLKNIMCEESGCAILKPQGGSVGRDIVSKVKKIADVAKKYNDIEFYRKIVELEGEVIELSRRKRQAEDRIEELEKKLALKARMQFKQPFYFQEGDAVPFCPNCYEEQTLAMHVVLKGETDSRASWACPSCRQGYVIEKPGAARGWMSQVAPSSGRY